MNTNETIGQRQSSTTFPFPDKDGTYLISNLDSLELIKLCAGDPSNSSAWEEFTARFVGKIQEFVMRISWSLWARNSLGSFWKNSPREMEDLVQEVLLRLITNECHQLKKFVGENEDSFLRYLWVVSSSVVIDRYRSARRIQDQETSIPAREKELTALDRLGFKRGDLRIERSILVREIIQLAEEFLDNEIKEAETRRRYMLVFRLYLFEGLSLSEISKCCNINMSKAGVDRVLARIIRGLKERLRISKEPA